MAIDILFIIMAAFGFYFGYTFGLMKVALMVVSLGFATFSAMAFTPMTPFEASIRCPLRSLPQPIRTGRLVVADLE